MTEDASLLERLRNQPVREFAQITSDELREYQWLRIRALCDTILPNNPYWAANLAKVGLNQNTLTDWNAFARIPFTTKSELASNQLEHPPYGSNLSRPPGEYVRLHQTSGTTTGQPLRWLDSSESWAWILECWRQIYELLEIRRDDRFFFPFSFGPFLGFWAGFEAATSLGRFAVAGGGLSSEARLLLMRANEITVLACTPSYALRLAEVAEAGGLMISEWGLRMVLVAGEPGGLIPGTRERIERAWGARVVDHWGMTEIGPLAIETTAAPGCLTVLESECYAEVIDPRTLRPVAPGVPGELVITNFGRVDSPLIRYRTGDIVVAETTPPPTGYPPFLRLRAGVLGRTDDMLIIRGNNVFPSSVESIVREFAGVAEYRILLAREREMDQLRLEVEPIASLEQSRQAELVIALSQRVKDRLNLQPDIKLVTPGSLPRFEMKSRRVVRV